MFMYTNSTGNHLCQGMDDLHKCEGANFDLSPMIVTDEQHQIVGVQTKHCSWQDSMPMIKAMREEDNLLKAQQSDRQIMRKSFKQTAPLHLTAIQQASASRSNQAGFSKILADLDVLKRNDRQMRKAMSW